jgi:hypothetical protein
MVARSMCEHATFQLEVAGPSSKSRDHRANVQVFHVILLRELLPQSSRACSLDNLLTNRALFAPN